MYEQPPLWERIMWFVLSWIERAWDSRGWLLAILAAAVAGGIAGWVTSR